MSGQNLLRKFLGHPVLCRLIITIITCSPDRFKLVSYVILIVLDIIMIISMMLLIIFPSDHSQISHHHDHAQVAELQQHTFGGAPGAGVDDQKASDPYQYGGGNQGYSS